MRPGTAEHARAMARLERAERETATDLEAAKMRKAEAHRARMKALHERLQAAKYPEPGSAEYDRVVAMRQRAAAAEYQRRAAAAVAGR